MMEDKDGWICKMLLMRKVPAHYFLCIDQLQIQMNHPENWKGQDLAMFLYSYQYLLLSTHQGMKCTSQCDQTELGRHGRDGLLIRTEPNPAWANMQLEATE